MINQPIFSLFIRLFPEAFLFIYSIYRLTNTKPDYKMILKSSIIASCVIYVLRLLPIHFGVHTILAIMLYILLAVKINKIEIHKAIASTLVAMISLFISDFTIVLIYTKIFKLSSDIIFGQTWVATALGLPSLFIFYLIILLISLVRKKGIKHE